MEFKQGQLEVQKTRLVVTKAAALPEGQFKAVLSTSDLDRHGEHVSIPGLKVPERTIKMYYNHETNGPNLPIGKWLKIWKKDGKLWGHGEVDLNDDFAVKVYKKILGGFIDSISIGFYPKEYDGETSTWTMSELVEASVVAEPANVNAIITSKDLGFTQEEFKQSFKVKLKQVVNDDDLFVGEEGKPPQEVVSDPAANDLIPPSQSEPAIDSNSLEAKPDEPSSEAGAADTEMKAALNELKSRMDALESAHDTATDTPTTKQLIRVRVAAKQVDKATENLNRVIKVKLKETHNV